MTKRDYLDLIVTAYVVVMLFLVGTITACVVERLVF